MIRERQRGQGLVEGAIVLVVFAALLFGIADCGQVLFAHQSLVERARSAVRWSIVRPWQGPDAVINLILYGQAEQPDQNTPGYLGLTAANVKVSYQPPTSDRPDDETLTVAIVNYESHFFSPWLAHTLISARPVYVSSPMASRSEIK